MATPSIAAAGDDEPRDFLHREEVPPAGAPADGPELPATNRVPHAAGRVEADEPRDVFRGEERNDVGAQVIFSSS
jgi:hypothetical protein